VIGAILGIDGSLPEFSAALVGADGATLGSASAPGSQALEEGLRAIAAALDGRSVRDLSAVAVCVGPGSYTGSRIAVSFAKALAQAGRLPIVAVSSYDALEPEDAPRPFLTVVPARTGLICARLSEDGGSQTSCGDYDQVAGWLCARAPGEVPCVAPREDDLSGLAERGCHVRSIGVGEPAAVRVARLALTRAPEPEPLAIVADYGFPPVAPSA
jgi:tRNA threonylcarbamoyladenosine biosynthesis protein TsaB